MIESFQVYNSSENPERTLSAASFILRELYHEPSPDKLLVDIQLENMQSTTIITAHSDQGLIIAAAGLKEPLPNHEGQIIDVATAGSMRKLGLGKAIIGHLEQVAIDRGVETLQLQSLPETVGFYKKLGYHESNRGLRRFVKHLQ